jgi:ribosomal protein S18 acetylase RimI-like enzyme
MIEIREIISASLTEYFDFLKQGLIADEENFRITPEDDKNAHFPTKDRQDSFTLGAYNRGILCGIVSFTRDGADRQKLRHKGILFRMYVAAPYRGQGISRLLISAVLERIRQIEDIEQVTLTVIAGNDRAKHLYEKFGFKSFGKEERAIK